jgi:hypothetical protein
MNITAYTDTTYQLDCGDATVLVEVHDDGALTVYTPIDAADSLVEGVPYFAALHQLSDGTVADASGQLRTVDGSIEWVDVVGDGGRALAATALAAWNADAGTPERVTSSRTVALGRQLVERREALTRAVARRDEAAAAVELAEERVVDIEVALGRLGADIPTAP